MTILNPQLTPRCPLPSSPQHRSSKSYGLGWGTHPRPLQQVDKVPQSHRSQPLAHPSPAGTIWTQMLTGPFST